MIHLSEIIIIIAIIAIVVGIGRVQKIGASLHQAKLELEHGKRDERVIDITPRSETSQNPSKPGTRRAPVEDAEVEPV